MDREFIERRIERIKVTIEAYEDAIDALAAAGGIQSYTLDTGQDRQSVTRSDIPALTNALDVLYNRLAVFETRLRGSATLIGGPAW